MSLAPAASKDGFSYAGDLFVEASGLNRHRRATVAELKDHFKSGSDKDHPAHWFEAQCIHYGLQPSKTKAVARMRLFDAVNGDKLSVPSHIKKLESELKKEWTKNEREAKKAAKDTSSLAAKSTKRKAATDTVDLTLNVGGINITVSANSSSKKTKSATTKATVSKPSKTTTAPKAAPSSTAKAKAKPAASPKKNTSSAAPSSSAPTPSTPTTRGRAPRGRGGLHQGPSRNSVPAPSSSPQRPIPVKTPGKLARCSRGRGRGLSSGLSSSQRTGYNNDLDNEDSGVEYGGYIYDSSSSVKDEDEGEGELKPLGLLNGRYAIRSGDVMTERIDLSLVLTLSGSQLWGSFDLGTIHGIMKLESRPYQSSYQTHAFTWRGREEGMGRITYGNGHEGWIKFLGDGRIEAYLDDYSIFFSGERMPGQGTRSEIDAATMKAEWNCYTYELYKEENRINF
ncbi:hypothetical protein F4805DRAFT_433320 [Annulohypoxylon moriforme]|nr:hypothetical protein F4805DRAFT_433320 [Annulohypoxylon moriforme]